MSTPRLSIATIATPTPMGAQAYERRIIAHAADALRETSTASWRVRELVVRSLRSPLPGTRRLPMRVVARAPVAVRREIGRMLFAGDAVSHRMGLELPPSPHADVVTLHDVVAWRFSDESTPVPAAVEELRRAAAVICVSEFSAREAVEVIGIRHPHVVHNGVDARYFDAAPLDDDALARLGVRRPYVLHAGGAAERKNLGALAEAWPRVHRERPEHTLVLAGPPHPRRTALFEGMPGAVLLGRVPDDLMPGLVAAASAVVVPSLYEGFGLPVLEAMAANVPAVVANTSSLPEVASGHAVMVEPDAASIAAGLIDATADRASLAGMLRDAREHAGAFTWERSALAHARIWDSV
ncbi:MULTISPECIES: glycosyltransferase family 4 protein [Microbacterium]|uniref:glycosyltransferase family 4 protein n=1 Tax=Microbacterium TaxID=33882 RepID=UPI00217E06A0|nr:MULTISPECIES: glycosyltransferase family 1 protein [Microbacterium]UWF77888.1 glycosyltransferase family 4 protein [Microbacterium neungamense]WCM56065.1 glycosyltransferase family 4 protein [Microbacterium sp. EF45047]